MICIEELHHEQIRHWARYAAKCPYPPAVLSLDYHTDTLSALRRLPVLPDDPEVAIASLHHDEHFDWALRKHIIRRAVILSHVPDPSPPRPELTVVGPSNWPPMADLLNQPALYRPLADRVTEQDSLSARLNAAEFDLRNERGFIFDLDLDYFLTAKAFRPDNASLFRELFQRAGLITISRERDWVRILKLDPRLPEAEFFSGWDRESR